MSQERRVDEFKTTLKSVTSSFQKKKNQMDGHNFYQIELLDQRELSILRVEAENEELRRLNAELWTELLQVNQELANFEAEHEDLEGKYLTMKNNIDKRLKKIEKPLKKSS